MTRWVALLRGVNVGGVTIRSVGLAEVFAGLGFEAVTTFLASGNVTVIGTTLDTPFAKVLSRSRYKATTTSRNLRTLVKIVA